MASTRGHCAQHGVASEAARDSRSSIHVQAALTTHAIDDDITTSGMPSSNSEQKAHLFSRHPMLESLETLQKACKRRSLSSSGKKGALIRRLEKAGVNNPAEIAKLAEEYGQEGPMSDSAA